MLNMDTDFLSNLSKLNPPFVNTTQGIPGSNIPIQQPRGIGLGGYNLLRSTGQSSTSGFQIPGTPPHARGNLHLEDKLYLEENLLLEGNPRLEENLLTMDNPHLDNLLMEGNFSLEDNLCLEGSPCLEDNLLTVGNPHLVDKILTEGNLSLEENLLTEGNLCLLGNLLSEGNLHLGGNLMLRGDLKLEPIINLLVRMCLQSLIRGTPLFWETNSSLGDVILKV
jgi:hypothetical protein